METHCNRVFSDNIIIIKFIWHVSSFFINEFGHKHNVPVAVFTKHLHGM